MEKGNEERLPFSCNDHRTRKVLEARFWIVGVSEPDSRVWKNVGMRKHGEGAGQSMEAPVRRWEVSNA